MNSFETAFRMGSNVLHLGKFACQCCSVAISGQQAALLWWLFWCSIAVLQSRIQVWSGHMPHMLCLPVQAYVSRARVDSFSLIADMMYVSSNAPRIARSVFEICLRRGWSSCAELALTLCKV